MGREEQDWLAERFEHDRARLTSVAYRMVGSRAAADDAVQEAWLRLARSDIGDIDNLAGWLTTVVARVSLDILRSQRVRDQTPLTIGDGDHEPSAGDLDPAEEAALADSVGEALLVVLDTLAPAERLAFVLHDSFDVDYDEIGEILGRSPVATKQLAHRARTKVRNQSGPPDGSGRERQRELVDKFLAASRDGDFRRLVSMLDPGVVIAADERAVSMGAEPAVRGADAVAAVFSGRALAAQPAVVDGAVGVAWAVEGQLRVVWDFIIERDRVTHIDMLADEKTLDRLEVTLLSVT